MDLDQAGGTAFPLQFNVIGPACDPITGNQVQAGHTNAHVFVGATLRDYFAAHAPAAPDDFGWAPGECDSWQRSSRWAYVYADAMLAARSAA